MKQITSLHGLVTSLVWFATLTTTLLAQSTSRPSERIPVPELGPKADAQHHGDELSVTPTPEGARLRCVFQKLEGHVIPGGLWLTSTVEPQTGEKFRVVAAYPVRIDSTFSDADWVSMSPASNRYTPSEK